MNAKQQAICFKYDINIITQRLKLDKDKARHLIDWDLTIITIFSPIFKSLFQCETNGYKILECNKKFQTFIKMYMNNKIKTR